MSDFQHLIRAMEETGAVPLIVLGVILEPEVRTRISCDPRLLEVIQAVPQLIDAFQHLLAQLRELSKPPDDQHRAPGCRVMRWDDP